MCIRDSRYRVSSRQYVSTCFDTKYSQVGTYCTRFDIQYRQASTSRPVLTKRTVKQINCVLVLTSSIVKPIRFAPVSTYSVVKPIRFSPGSTNSIVTPVRFELFWHKIPSIQHMLHRYDKRFRQAKTICTFVYMQYRWASMYRPVLTQSSNKPIRVAPVSTYSIVKPARFDLFRRKVPTIQYVLHPFRHTVSSSQYVSQPFWHTVSWRQYVF